MTDQDADNFYRMCLYGLLTDIRAFSEEHLKDFCISEIYRNAFLKKNVQTNLDARTEVFYTFSHEVLYELFSALYINTAPEHRLKSLLLAIYGRASMRNVQKILYELLPRNNIERGHLLVGTVRAIIILQSDAIWSMHSLANECLELKKSTSFGNFDEDLHEEHSNEHQVEGTKALWEKINEICYHRSVELKTVSWFVDLEKNGTIRHIFECLRSFTQQQQEEVLRQTLQYLMPCTCGYG